MPIPNADAAVVPEEKLTGYLLNEGHTVGGAKARWFGARGFVRANASELADALLDLVRSSEEFVTEATRYGAKHVVRGDLSCPDGRVEAIMTVWMTPVDASSPRLVTAYPEAS
jgi:hypothetical protein